MHYVIIGNSAAGIKAAETLRLLDNSSIITIISDEKENSYSRCLLPEYLSGDRSRDELIFRDKDFYRKNSIRTELGKKVVSIDPDRSLINFEDGRQLSYDKLLIATGASSFIPPIPGIKDNEVFGLRDLKDAEDILERAKKGSKVVVVGGGFVGLEAAYALNKLGLDVTVVEMLPQILAIQFDETAADILSKDMQKDGIKILTGVATKEIAAPTTWERILGKKEKKVILGNGEVLKADIILVTTGTRTNVALAKNTDISINKGILVDEYMETNVKNIYAAGDVCETKDTVSEKVGLSPIWPNAMIQGKIAAYNMAGSKKELTGLVGMQNAVEFREIPAIAMGLSKATEEEGYEILKLYRPGQNVYKKIVLKNNIVKGMIIVGDISSAGVIGAFIKNKADVSEFKHRLLEKGFCYGYLWPKGA